MKQFLIAGFVCFTFGASSFAQNITVFIQADGAGTCSSGATGCTLRQAVNTANALGGSDIYHIQLRPLVYTLDIPDDPVPGQ